MKEFRFELSEDTIRDLHADCPNFLTRVHNVKKVLNEMGVVSMGISTEDNQIDITLPLDHMVFSSTKIRVV